MDFEDHDAFKKWLDSQSRETCTAIAVRAALRIWPIIIAQKVWRASPDAQVSRQNVAVASGRCLIAATSAVQTGIEAKEGENPSNDAEKAVQTFLSSIYQISCVEGIDLPAAISPACYAAQSASSETATIAARLVREAQSNGLIIEHPDFSAVPTPPFVEQETQNARNSVFADCDSEALPMFSRPLWSDDSFAIALRPERVGRTLFDTDPRFDFFRRWYDGMVRGEPLDWELQRRVALIPQEVWESGADAVAEAVAEIEAAWEAEQAGIVPTSPVSEKEVSVVTQRVAANRDALAVSSASLLEQLDDFRERVRGMNALDPDIKEELLAFIDRFRAQLDALLHDLPPPGEEVGEERGNRMARWLRGYRAVLITKLAHYSSPENMGEATVPTAIILGATGVGAMMGAPLAGAAVGGLIVNQMKPGQAAKELMKSDDPSSDGPS